MRCKRYQMWEAVSCGADLLIPLSRPSITEAERAAVLEVLDSGQLANGPRALTFADRVALRAGGDPWGGVATSSGTAALALALKVLRIPAGSEIITSAYGFCATPAVIEHHECRPVFVDCLRSGLIDPDAVRRAVTRSTSSVLGADLYGSLCDWHRIREVVPPSVQLIADSCEALGAERDGGAIMTHPVDAATFGHFPNKQICAAEGGVLLVRDIGVAERARCLTSHGRDGVRVVEPGFNYRMSELHAALGLAQLDRFQELQQRRSEIAHWYTAHLPACVRPLPTDPGRSWFVYVVTCDRPAVEVVRELEARGVQARRYFPPLTYEPAWCHVREAFPMAAHLGTHAVALPFFPDLTTDQQRAVIEALAEVVADGRPGSSAA